jgi:tRNA pseudouridine13 synthase
MKSSAFEHQIGIETFCTQQPGIGGKLRTFAEDFQVNELFLYPPKKEDGRFTIAEVSCKNWETHTLVHELADQLHVSQKRISFAGTKDKRALSTQLMSFDQIAAEHVSRLNIKDVHIQNIYRSDVPVRIGDLHGNRFEITVRNIEKNVTHDHIKTLLSQLETYGGFPNFYGIQRFGVIRPITHLVGKYIIQGDFENAVMMYVAHPLRGESEETYVLREELEKTRDYGKAFHSYPDTLNFEKAMLNKLIQHPKDFVGALKELPKNLLLMFVNAYESYLFNMMLSERLRRKIPFHRAVVGDLVCPVRKNLMTEEYIPVIEVNLEKVNTQLSKRKAVVTGLLVGSDVVVADGEMGAIEQMVVAKEKIVPRDFIIPDIPFLSSSGSRRALLAMVPSVESMLQPDEQNEGKQKLILRFELHKGCYATSLLREIMKSDNPKNY